MPNHLANETSPYLLQHADNPVDWHPWSEEALTLARASDKPILLSIGYSACHWCHVMAHESFEDAATAAVMNAHFINIKVDREERPDLDQIYQQAHSILSRRNGGWPLTMFLTPDQIPFFGGTYFPPEPRYGMPGFTDLLQQIAAAWHNRRGEIEQQNASVLNILTRAAHTEDPARLDGSIMSNALEQLDRLHDPINGGFGGAPKFPNPSDLGLMLHGSSGARQKALFTLEKMANGGIYDHVGGGFCRYSVDGHWEIPHFEKMLYDNGQLLRLYSKAWLMTGDRKFRKVVEQTVAWTLHEMRSPSGAFYSSLDADSDGEEGKFYVWQREELRQLLTEQEYALLKQGYGLDQTPNFEHAWHLRISDDNHAVVNNLDEPATEALWESARQKLQHARDTRIRPGRDEKLLTSWNGLMIAGLARAGRVFGQTAWIEAAQQALDFIHDHMWNDGRLLATCKDGKAHLNAYLDDHAFLLQALLELLQADFRNTDLAFASQLADALITRFEDAGHGGFYFTSHDHESLIQRPKSASDNATPAGNGIAAHALQRLGHLLGEPRYLTAAEKTLRAFSNDLHRNPAACPSLAMALDEYLTPPNVAILRGPEAELKTWKRALDQQWFRNALVVAIPENETGLPQVLNRPLQHHVNAWVCSGVECLPAINKLEALMDVLQPLGKSPKTRL